ncbi:MAG: thioredoxin domain-containing protein [Balneolaceae bacterium]|nr:thioredoxin domain-containing protein [Balneolaceae bacterium]
MPSINKNSLSEAKSPYLLQHADNPVHWFSWSEEAFEIAKKEDKPIFLSIGYATCHWCHVMAHESFEDETVAELMNKTFINIKVDREERPDIDNTYMHVCQMLTGRGGWPLTIIMTPDKKPFYAATYIPKTGRQGQPGMMELVPRLAHLWDNERDKVNGSAKEITQAFQKSIQPDGSGTLPDDILPKAYNQLKKTFDAVHGGFGSAPKFPTPHTLIFLLRYAHTSGKEEAGKMVEKTLTAMRHGGLFDHLGGGFHRYSTDAHWLLPHFEKMLYDQAMHLMAYTEGFQLLGNPLFEQTVHDIATYLLRDLQHADGPFYSAEDADSEGEEGTFYVWTIDEIREIFSGADTELAIEVFNLQEEGNYADESTGRRTGKNILHRTKSIVELADDRDIDEAVLKQKLNDIKKQLFDVREKRERPFLDDKILTDWNGLAIAALAKAGRIFDNAEYITQAERALQFIYEHLQNDNGTLLHRYRDGKAAIAGTTDDYAFLIWGLIELYEATFKTEYLQKAIHLQTMFIETHWDEQQGGFFFTSSESEELLGRKKEYFDSALPSGNSVAALNLLRLGRITATPDWEQKVENIMQSTAKTARQAPASFTQLLQAHLWATGNAFEVVIAGNKDEPKTRELLKKLREEYYPHKVLILNSPGDNILGDIAPFTAHQKMQNGKPTAYVCRNYSCEEPTNDAERMMALLRE